MLFYNPATKRRILRGSTLTFTDMLRAFPVGLCTDLMLLCFHERAPELSLVFIDLLYCRHTGALSSRHWATPDWLIDMLGGILISFFCGLLGNSSNVCHFYIEHIEYVLLAHSPPSRRFLHCSYWSNPCLLKWLQPSLQCSFISGALVLHHGLDASSVLLMTAWDMASIWLTMI